MPPAIFHPALHGSMRSAHFLFAAKRLATEALAAHLEMVVNHVSLANQAALQTRLAEFFLCPLFTHLLNVPGAACAPHFSVKGGVLPTWAIARLRYQKSSGCKPRDTRGKEQA